MMAEVFHLSAQLRCRRAFFAVPRGSAAMVCESVEVE
jgi:hypothetical protein